MIRSMGIFIIVLIIMGVLVLSIAGCEPWMKYLPEDSPKFSSHGDTLLYQSKLVELRITGYLMRANIYEQLCDFDLKIITREDCVLFQTDSITLQTVETGQYFAQSDLLTRGGRSKKTEYLLPPHYSQSFYYDFYLVDSSLAEQESQIGPVVLHIQGLYETSGSTICVPPFIFTPANNWRVGSIDDSKTILNPGDERPKYWGTSEKLLDMLFAVTF